MVSIVCRFSIVGLCLILCLCQKKTEEAKDLLSINGKIISMESFNAFREMLRVYPTPLPKYFVGDKSNVRTLIETEILYSKSLFGISKSAIKEGNDWQWRKRYFYAQRYFESVINSNLGVSTTDIKNYYQANRDSFIVSHVRPDSTKKDSIIYRPFEQVKNQIAEKLFLKNNQPDSAFLAGIKNDSALLKDKARTNQMWVGSVRRNANTFFMNSMYKEKFNKPFPTDAKEWYGENKFITPQDLETIYGWLPEQARKNYTSQRDSVNLAQFLLQWQLFSDKARKDHTVAETNIKQLLSWAWKFQVACVYVDKKIVERAKSSAGTLDSTMCWFAVSDDGGINNFLSRNPASYSSQIDKYTEKKLILVVDSSIYAMRKKKDIKILSGDWKDDSDMDPVALMKTADSLRDSSNLDLAEAKYTSMTKFFLFLPEGKRALTELAKVQSDKGRYREAILNYRDYLMLSSTAADRCKIFFMIGFVYDEYMNRPDYAELNYKWILKYTPDCELADDAEFMCLHLDEEMNNIDELQAQAKRQGHAVEKEPEAVESAN